MESGSAGPRPIVRQPTAGQDLTWVVAQRMMIMMNKKMTNKETHNTFSF